MFQIGYIWNSNQKNKTETKEGTEAGRTQSCKKNVPIVINRLSFQSLYYDFQKERERITVVCAFGHLLTLRPYGTVAERI